MCTPTEIQRIKAGTLTSVWQVRSEKAVSTGDELTLFNSETGEQFGVATVTHCVTKTLSATTPQDWVGQDLVASNDLTLATYQQYFGNQVSLETQVSRIDFVFVQKLFARVVIVDDFDHVIGAEYLAIAIEKGLRRRSAGVLLHNEQGDVLMQTRGSHINHPGKKDFSSSGHVDVGETYEQAAVRELAEELGITSLPLVPLGPPVRVTDYYFSLFTATLPQYTEIAFDATEVAGVTWYTPAELQSEISLSPENFTLTCREVAACFQSQIYALTNHR